MTTEMVATSNRAFWQLGDQMHLGPIPRPAFGDFLRKGFESAGAIIANGALERQHFLRQDLAGITAAWRFEDPFMRAWLATLANQ